MAAKKKIKPKPGKWANAYLAADTLVKLLAHPRSSDLPEIKKQVSALRKEVSKFCAFPGRERSLGNTLRTIIDGEIAGKPTSPTAFGAAKTICTIIVRETSVSFYRRPEGRRKLSLLDEYTVSLIDIFQELLRTGKL